MPTLVLFYQALQRHSPVMLPERQRASDHRGDAPGRLDVYFVVYVTYAGRRSNGPAQASPRPRSTPGY